MLFYKLKGAQNDNENIALYNALKVKTLQLLLYTYLNIPILNILIL